MLLHILVGFTKEMAKDMKEIEYITDMSYLFQDCNNLSSLLIFQKKNFLKITKKIDERLSESNSSISLDGSEKSNWNTLSEIEKNDFYYGCNPLFFNELSSILSNKSYNFNDNNEIFQMNNLSFPFINHNVINMKNIFSGCSSLKSLPNISEWVTSNVNDMSNLFEGCSSLISIPDISKW